MFGTAVSAAGCSAGTLQASGEESATASTEASESDGEASGSEGGASGAGGEEGPASGSSSGPGSSFVDTGGVPQDDPTCDVWAAADACPPGEKCTVVFDQSWGDFDNRCRAVLGEAKAGEPCFSFDAADGLDSCDAESVCWDPDPDTKVGMCMEFCGGHPSAPRCSGTAVCNMDKSGIRPLCMERCSPLDDPCPVGCSCQPGSFESAFVCLPVSDEPSGEGAPCNFTNACASGLACVSSSVYPCDEAAATTGGCCAPYCDLSSVEGCAAEGTSCEPFYTDLDPTPDPSVASLGLCLSNAR